MAWTQRDIPIPYYICDCTDHLSLQFLGRIFQDAADAHTAHHHLGYADLAAQGLAWVISRVYYKVHEMPAAMSHVEVTTWSRRADRLCAMRDTEMRDEAGRLLVASTSMWVIMDMQRRTVTRMLDGIVRFDHEARRATDRDALHKMRATSPQDGTVAAHLKATHANIDHNLHVNNTDYIRWVVDAIREDPSEGRPIDTFEIDYFHETRQGDAVTLYQHEEGGRRFFQVANPLGTAALAAVTFK